MLQKVLFTTLTLLALTLSGCTSDSGGDDHDDDDGHHDVTECPEGYKMAEDHSEHMEEGAMDGNESTSFMVLQQEGEPEAMEDMDHGDEIPEGCVLAGPTVTVTILGLPATTQVFTPLTFQWELTTELEEDHAMRTEMRIATESTPVDESTQADDWGTSVTLFEHQNFESGKTFDASWTPELPGIYYFRAFALAQQANIWSGEVMVEVTNVQETGVDHPVELGLLCLPVVGGSSPDDVTIALGDTVTWTADTLGGLLDSFTITGTGPMDFTAGTDEAVLLTLPGSYTYQADGLLSTLTVSCAGSITVEVPGAAEPEAP